MDRLTLDVRAGTEARTSLEARYFGGEDVLLVDAAVAWSRHVELVEGVAGLAEVTGESKPGRAKRGARGGGTGLLAARADELAERLADDARIRAYEVLGDRERAVSIMERRLRTMSV